MITETNKRKLNLLALGNVNIDFDELTYVKDAVDPSMKLQTGLYTDEDKIVGK